jgi:FkbM family methyltransferase
LCVVQSQPGNFCRIAENATQIWNILPVLSPFSPIKTAPSRWQLSCIRISAIGELMKNVVSLDIASTAHRQQDSVCLQAALMEFDRWIDPSTVRVALDVGSRDGFIASCLADQYPDARVTAFECNPDAVAICEQQLRENSRVSLVPKAIGDTIGEVTFYPIDPERTVTPHADVLHSLQDSASRTHNDSHPAPEQTTAPAATTDVKLAPFKLVTPAVHMQPTLVI